MTRRVKLCTGVAILPIHNPVLNARQIASIDLYSRGRVLYGIGVGWLKEEADAMGMPWDRRGARTDEHIALYRALWTAEGESVEFHGRFYDVPPMDPDPRPVQRPIPILIGGHSDPALDRAVRLGDGWVAAGMGQDRFVVAMDRLRTVCDRYDRDIADLQIINGEHTDVLLDPTKGDLKAQIDRAIDGLKKYEAMGVTHMKVSIRGNDPGAILEMVDVFGRDVLPAARR